MRNGNEENVKKYLEKKLFLSYLWGMETSFLICQFSKDFWFLSYLWGMETLLHLFDLRCSQHCSYPTYEEWKLERWRYTYEAETLGSYPTYEEWKLAKSISKSILFFVRFLSYLWGMETLLISQTFCQFDCSYPTYEEWKQQRKEQGLIAVLVLILPMRNGNHNIYKKNMKA